MNIWNLILAVLPPLLLAYYIYSRDLYEKEPRKLVLKCLFYGALAFIPIFYIELFIIEVFSDGKFELLNSVFLFSLIGVALVEEGVKFWKNYLKMGKSGILGGSGLGIAMITFIYSITNTSAAITLLCLLLCLLLLHC